MLTVSLTTDWGNSGIYTGLFKAKLIQRLPGTQIVDISNEIKAFDVGQAVFSLRNAFSHFPQKTIHIVSVASANIQDKAKNHEYVCLQYNYQYFIGPNNGLWNMLFEETPTEVYKIPTAPQKSLGNFQEADAIVETINKIAIGLPIDRIGEKTTCYSAYKMSAPIVTDNMLEGRFLYFDSYGNGITNIPIALFETARRDRHFTIMVDSKRYSTDEITENYEPKDKSAKIMALYNVSGFLEIAIPYNPLEKFFHIDSEHTSIFVHFYDTEEEKNNFGLI